MTREEFINWLDDRYTLTKNDIYELGQLYDEVTKPQWISVEDYSKDELPLMLDDKDQHGESVCVLFVVELDGNQYINKGTFDYDTGVWHSLDMQCSFCKENVTHWMPMPQPPTIAKNATVKEKGDKE